MWIANDLPMTPVNAFYQWTGRVSCTGHSRAGECARHLGAEVQRASHQRLNPIAKNALPLPVVNAGRKLRDGQGFGLSSVGYAPTNPSTLTRAGAFCRNGRTASPESMDGMLRNRWTPCSGFGGRLGPEYAS